MGRVNWVEAREMYIADSRNSYSRLGKLFGVSKSTIQAKGTKEDWPALRRRGVKKSIEAYASDREMRADEMNKRHLEMYKMMEIIAANMIVDFSRMDADARIKQVAALGTIGRVCRMAITEQRKILGLPNGNPDDWLDLSKKPEISIDDAIHTLDKLITRQQRLERRRSQRKAELL